MECNTVAGSVTWLFREVPWWPRETRVERGVSRGCNDAAGRGKDRGHKRPARRDARGGAPSFVSFRGASLYLASPFSFFSPPAADSVSTPCETSLVPTFAAAISRFPLFARATVIFCGNPQMWLGRIRAGQLGLRRSAGWVCEKPASLTPARCARRTRHCCAATS